MEQLIASLAKEIQQASGNKKYITAFGGRKFVFSDKQKCDSFRDYLAIEGYVAQRAGKTPSPSDIYDKIVQVIEPDYWF